MGMFTAFFFWSAVLVVFWPMLEGFVEILLSWRVYLLALGVCLTFGADLFRSAVRSLLSY